MTTEQKLQAITVAQDKSGFSRWKTLMWAPKGAEPLMPAPEIALACLLDPAGLKAAYGEAMVCTAENCMSPLRAWRKGQAFGWTAGECGHTFQQQTRELMPWTRAICIAHRILDTWLSSNGDAAKTIDTAYELLPKSLQ